MGMLGAPIGDIQFCTAFVEEKQLETHELLQLLPKLHDPQVAVTLLHMSCVLHTAAKLVHIAHSTPSDLVTTHP